MPTSLLPVYLLVLLCQSAPSAADPFSIKSSIYVTQTVDIDHVTKLCKEKSSRVVFLRPRQRQVFEVKDGQNFALNVKVRLVSNSGKSLKITDSVLKASSKISLKADSFSSNLIAFSNQSRLLLKSTRLLDRERDGEILPISLRVFIRGCNLHSRRNFVIRVTDVNDNVPQFHNFDFKSGYAVSIRQDATAGSVVKTVSVTDGDATSPNNMVKLKSLPPYDNVFVFGGDDMILNNARALHSFRRRLYNVIIEAKDRGVPPLSNRTVVRVYIRPAIFAVPRVHIHTYTSLDACHLKAVVVNKKNASLSTFSSTTGYLEITNITSRNVKIHKGLWILYSNDKFQGETTIVHKGNVKKSYETASLRGFCLDKPFLALFNQWNFAGEMTVLYGTTNRLSLKTKSALVFKNSWAMSLLGFIRPHLLECTNGVYTEYPSTPIGQVLVKAVKKLSSDGTIAFKNFYGN